MFIIVAVKQPCKIIKIKCDSMRFKRPGASLDNFREKDQRLDQGNLFRNSQQLRISIFKFGDTISSFLSHPENTADPRMGVLDIVNRVFIRLPLGQFQIEVKMTVRTPHKEIIASSITTNFLNNFLHRDKFSGPGRHRYRFAVPKQVYQLNKDDTQNILGIAQGLNPGMHPGNIAMVIRPPDINNRIKSPFILVLVVGDIRGKIGRFTILAHNYPIFVIAEICCFKPQSLIVAIYKAPVL
ncbi:MAG: hypothetical protein A4E66_01441 [Syntrophus sp. PtaB.Bin001]|nr:MAG: hypothetical protein A4E66_01441 [Syntrophus sp. PtaB.Bin001]